MTDETGRGSKPDGNFEAVVIGGSAGSVEALPRLLGRLQERFPLAVVVAVHLPSNAPSALPAVLSDGSPLPVREVEDKMPVEPSTVFVAPPGYHLQLEEGPAFSLSVDDPVNFARPSIDVLFQSAADVYGTGLVGVVLSGANQDGARGLRAIEDAGGLALVQAPEQAPSPTMPRAALDRCLRAEALDLEAIGARLRALGDEVLSRRGTT